MIIRIEDIKNACAKILPAVDVNNYSIVTETVQLSVENEVLTLSVTNKEYFVAVKIPVPKEPDFLATVNAQLFLKLISNITTETVQFTVSDNYLKIKGNGNYKLPLIFDGDSILEQPKIVIENKTQELTIEGEMLHSICNYNLKELSKGGGALFPIQNFFYLDEQGCVTFTSGACVNQFKLSENVKVLLTTKLVKLFKLFDSSDIVNFTIGKDTVSKELTQTKVMFNTDNIVLVAILPSDDSEISKFPVAAIRNRAFDKYDYTVTFNKEYLLQAITRLLILSSDSKIDQYLNLTFNGYKVVLQSHDNSSQEEVIYEKEIEMGGEEYTMSIDANDLRATLASCNEPYVTFSFGNHQAVTISRGKVINVISEKV